MSPVSAATGLAGLAVGHMRDHALSRTPKPDLMDVLTQTARSPILEVIEKFKIKKSKRSIGNDDEPPMKYVYKSPILLKKPNSGVAGGSEDESKHYCDVRDIQLEAIGEHLVRPQQARTNGDITELNEDLSEMNVRVRRSDTMPSSNQQQDSQQASNGRSTSNCPFHKHFSGVCSQGACAHSHNDFSQNQQINRQ